VKIGSGSLQYELDEGWEQLPAGWAHPDVAAVSTDSQGNIYLFCRAEHPVIIYDKAGKFLESWGEGQFSDRPHGMYIDADDYVYLVDDSDHTARKYTKDGKLLLMLGTSGQPSDTGAEGAFGPVKRAAGPFNRPTNMVTHPNGSLYVSDGYGNCRVHRFTAEGQLLESWGEPGSEQGCFITPHGIWVHDDGRLFVCDRENDRIQIFTPEGKFLDQWLDVQRPQDIYMDRDGHVFVGELVRFKGENTARNGYIEEDRPSRVSVFDQQGNLLLRWGGVDVAAPGNFVGPHDIWVDPEGTVYVAEVTYTMGVRRGLVPPETHTIQRFMRV
jgi:streptogramin lyase